MVERQDRLERCLSALELRILWNALSVLVDEAKRMLAEAQYRRMLAEAQYRETRPRQGRLR